jgi:hypothetical protein
MQKTMMPLTVAYAGYGVATLVRAYADVGRCAGGGLLWAYALTSAIQSLALRGTLMQCEPRPQNADSASVVQPQHEAAPSYWDVVVEFALAVWGGVLLTLYHADCLRFMPLFVRTSVVLQVICGLATVTLVRYAANERRSRSPRSLYFMGDGDRDCDDDAAVAL